ncbi:MAG: acetoacetate--CoA ligase [Pirellulaceae bacterium]|nr:acetoacetate--CoA ligase [Pirellulaceae bacterium]
MKLWQPSADQQRSANLTPLMQQVTDEHGLTFADFHAFYDWSVASPCAFWEAVWKFCEVRASVPYSSVLSSANRMPGARWFEGSRLNFAENLLRFRDDRTALVFWGEDKTQQRLTYAQLYQSVSSLAAHLRQQGVGPGDRVAGLMPNLPATVIAMLATTSVGAVWSSCSPDFGLEGVVDRFGQIEPKVFITADGYYYKGRVFPLLDKIDEILLALPSVEQVIVARYVGEGDLSTVRSADHQQKIWLEDILATDQGDPIEFAQVPFDHPLYVMYSSGTTGKPKCIVHSVGGTLIEHLKELVLHTDLSRNDTIFYATTCGWMMWNWLVSSLAVGATVVLYDGAPLLRDGRILFDLAEQEKINIFGTSAGFISAIKKAGLRPRETHSLDALRAILSTGSTLVPECFDYVYEHIKSDVCLSSISGGTDIIGCFALGCPLVPVYRGQLQARSLGYAVDVYNDEAQSIAEQKGELVCTAPFPSMPISFWNDPDGSKYHHAYFSRFDSVWHHGDYVMLTAEKGMVFYGRSDAVLMPGGVRIGTAEIYRQLEDLDEVVSSVAVGQEWMEDTRILLFVQLRPELKLDETLRNKIFQAIRTGATPRHLPAKILQVDDIPVTRSGKISELAVKNMVHSRPVQNVGALANPESLAGFRDRPELQQD